MCLLFYYCLSLSIHPREYAANSKKAKHTVLIIVNVIIYYYGNFSLLVAPDTLYNS